MAVLTTLIWLSSVGIAKTNSLRLLVNKRSRVTGNDGDCALGFSNKTQFHNEAKLENIRGECYKY